MKKMAALLSSVILISAILTACGTETATVQPDTTEQYTLSEREQSAETGAVSTEENATIEQIDTVDEEENVMLDQDDGEAENGSEKEIENKAEIEETADDIEEEIDDAKEEKAEAIKLPKKKQIEPWQQVYIDYVSQYQQDEDPNMFQLIYLDGDNIPELVDIGSCEAIGCRIINFSNGETHVTQLGHLNFTYIERENLLCNSDGNMDVYYDLVYSIIDGELTVTDAGYYGWYWQDTGEAFDRIVNEEAGEAVYRYKWNGREVSKKEYEQALNAVYDISRGKSYYDDTRYSAREMIEIIEECNSVYITSFYDVISLEKKNNKLKVQVDAGRMWDYFSDFGTHVADTIEYPIASDCRFECFDTDLLYYGESSYKDLKSCIEKERQLHVETGEVDSPVTLGIELENGIIVRVFTISS